MAITYPLALPTIRVPKKSKIRMLTAAAVSESPFDFTAQVFLHQGARWALDLQYPPMKRNEAEQFVAVFAKLKGRYGTFLVGDYDGRNPRGSAGGTPVVNGAGQTGETLITDGWPASKPAVLKAGDYLQLGSTSTTRLHKVLDDTASDGSGNATFTIWPPLRYSPADNAAIVVTNTKTQFRLDSPFEWDADEVSVYGFTITASEAL